MLTHKIFWQIIVLGEYNAQFCFFDDILNKNKIKINSKSLFQSEINYYKLFKFMINQFY